MYWQISKFTICRSESNIKYPYKQQAHFWWILRACGGGQNRTVLWDIWAMIRQKCHTVIRQDFSKYRLKIPIQIGPFLVDFKGVWRRTELNCTMGYLGNDLSKMPYCDET